MRQLNEYNLRDNPFQLTPTPGLSANDQTPWAGMSRLKKDINRIYDTMYENSHRQVVLNWGPYGGGKTFAAYYFIENVNPNDLELLQVYLRSPKVGRNANQEFYKSILDYISYRKIRNQISRIVNIMGEEDFFDFLHKRLRSEELVEAILKLATDDPDEQMLMNRYIYTGLTNTELKRIGLAKNISWGTDSIKFLAGIVLCFIGDQQQYKGRVVLWVDEMEDMIYYSQKEYVAFSQVLRDLIDQINQYFTVFFNFTLAETEEQTISMLLGGAMWERIDKKIRFSELDHKEALLYCKELLQFYHIEEKGEYYPFTQPSIDMILNLIPQAKLTPREINRYCRNVLNYAQEADVDLIDCDLVTACFEKLAESE